MTADGNWNLVVSTPMGERQATLSVKTDSSVLKGSQMADGNSTEIFGKVDKFESLASGTLRVGAPPKTIVDDGDRHVVVLTIWDADAETKVYWRSSDGNAPRTTVIPGRGVQTFQTLGEFKLEAIG